MDPVTEIKARLPIEQLVAQYVQIKPKGRSFVSLCPFHNDKHPSFLISPDKGIAYCFACNSGGDIFSFYQKIENVDFGQAVRDLAERVGITLPKASHQPKVDKDERERLRDCIEAAHAFFRSSLTSSDVAKQYLTRRLMSPELQEKFGVGYAPDSFSALYQHLLKKDFSRREIVAAGLGIQKELSEERIYDRFRNRLIFPIADLQGRIVAFGGRTLGDDDAKYINSSEGPIYHKGSTLFGLHLAREAIRKERRIIMVEGYFDVVACHKVGMENVVAVSGTALTEEHARIIKRMADAVVLCLDADRAGKDAAERSFQILSKEGIVVRVATLSAKDPDEVATTDPEGLRSLLSDRSEPYLDAVLREIREKGTLTPEMRKSSEDRALRLVRSIPPSEQYDHYRQEFGSIFGDTFKERLLRPEIPSTPDRPLPAGSTASVQLFSPMEIVLALFVLYPRLRNVLPELIAPDDGFPQKLFEALKIAGEGAVSLEGAESERLGVLLLFCEQHGFQEWSDGLAASEIRRNCHQANRATIAAKQREVTAKLVRARQEGRTVDEEHLLTQYQQILKLSKMAG